ncbi:unnamed protein product [Miscanthus lutarioriparius]|uniref:Uncharacterized protein n=1 Tax=Miscanthus lutarioriparius TaxID=422564 RepID=A0A811MKX1_9POAL|nr:unnamed protein product [Miscanthus lutarioriparius]
MKAAADSALALTARGQTRWRACGRQLPQNDRLTITVPGVALALATVSYLWATPGVASGFFDMFVLAFAERDVDVATMC